jgi:hypothetical protein
MNRYQAVYRYSPLLRRTLVQKHIWQRGSDYKNRTLSFCIKLPDDFYFTLLISGAVSAEYIMKP